ncbi:MAG: HD-GYP domain-containing protein, partial [Alkalispirochaetaceae bacterium]
IRLPPNIYMNDKPLNDQEKKAITAHTVLGFKILKQHDFPNPICLAVLECREHMDGTGYPRGLSGEKISPYARIIGVTSSYAAMISRRPFRPRTDGSTAMMEILKGKETRYDQATIRGLIMTLSLYPYGTYVQLKNGSTGMVTDIDPDHPRFPTVKLLTDSSGAVVKERPAIATTEEEYQVAGVLGHDEIEAIRSAL